MIDYDINNTEYINSFNTLINKLISASLLRYNSLELHGV